MSDEPKWQPVMLVVNRRVECQCGNLAIFVTGTLVTLDDYIKHYNVLEDVDVWCQECFKKAQEDE